MAAAVARPLSHNVLVTDMTPAVANLLEESTISPLRSVQHRDAQGNVITDPDLSNPTRPRLERPLDTIRSFERAIDSNYRRRTSYNRSESYNNSSRRNSYFNNPHNNGYDSRPSPGPGSNSYYGQPGSSNRDSYYSNGPSSSRRPQNGRQPSDYGSYNNNPPPPAHSSSYRAGGPSPPHHAAQPSQDTLATHASGASDSTGPWQSGTEPSSDNSSVERMNSYNNGYGHSSGAIPEDDAYHYDRQYEHQSHQQFGRAAAALAQNGPPPVPSKGGMMAPPPVSKLPPAAPRPAPAEKRKSWLSRRFSKSG